jgi:hypothetical protein
MFADDLPAFFRIHSAIPGVIGLDGHDGALIAMAGAQGFDGMDPGMQAFRSQQSPRFADEQAGTLLRA